MRDFSKVLGGSLQGTRSRTTSAKLLVLILAWAFAPAARCGDAESRPPNVVLFIMDDVGMGDIGCFGNDTIKTPNLDNLAQEGAKLTQHMALPLCTPSRAALITGRLPVRYGMGAEGRMRVFIYISARGGVPSNETTVAELLKDAGYATAMIGKWHLGISCTDENSCSDPNSQGFDYFYGLPMTNLRDCGTESTVSYAWAKLRRVYAKMAYSVLGALAAAMLLKWMELIGYRSVVLFLFVALAANGSLLMYWKAIRINCVLMENREIVEQPLQYDHLTERLHSRAVQFMESHQQQPFLLVMSFVQAHTALYNNDLFRNHSVHGSYGDNLEEMDWSVGEVLSSLKKLGLERNTFVYLTSDNGGHVEEFTDDGEREGGWNGIYKGGKGNTWEGGIRVPAIVKLPGVIPPGTVVSQPTHLPDVLPTVARVTGVKLPTDRIFDGRDLMPLLTNDSSEMTHEFMFHYCGVFINAVRYTPEGGDTTYKVHYTTSRLIPGPHGVLGCFQTYTCDCTGWSTDQHDPPLVYDLTRDPSEASPLDSKVPIVVEVIGKVEEAVSRHRLTIPEQQSHQFSVLQTFPRPWDRPRCGSFPFYTCTDPYLNHFKADKKKTPR
ncbi:steryl-sulfatase-like [Patiria miniata]|uniref:Sulfatase N-terminal domain-containing protein n=1 Tax=Patiria miniata TaxID=46514 RepID=A0A914BIY4_PATMI|nr:steryl-sulfatase-like [Patiria miniata]XP_038075781.1 steryl-sulfatase-like [Patiria miniata]XP_038075796.1 steryl-sulfatase-like [Patiria miniata]